MGHRAKKELKKPKTAEDKGKRYRCCICRKRAPRKTKQVPYYCAEHESRKDSTEDFFFSSSIEIPASPSSGESVESP